MADILDFFSDKNHVYLLDDAWTHLVPGVTAVHDYIGTSNLKEAKDSNNFSVMSFFI